MSNFAIPNDSGKSELNSNHGFAWSHPESLKLFTGREFPQMALFPARTDIPF